MKRFLQRKKQRERDKEPSEKLLQNDEKAKGTSSGGGGGRKKHERRTNDGNSNNPSKNMNILRNQQHQHHKLAELESSSEGTCTATAAQTHLSDPVPGFEPNPQRRQKDSGRGNQHSPSNLTCNVEARMNANANAAPLSTKSIGVLSQVSCTKSTPRASRRTRREDSHHSFVPINNNMNNIRTSMSTSSRSTSTPESSSRDLDNDPESTPTSPPRPVSTSRSSPAFSPSPNLAIPRLSKNLPPFPYRSNHNNNTSSSISMPMSNSISKSKSHSQHQPLGKSSTSTSASTTASSSNYDYAHSHLHEISQNHPARLKWNVQDSKLKPIPPMHPPIPMHQTTFVDCASPSIVASRIDACLKKRSLLVEYDEDAAVATVFTKERGCFVIQLYRGGKLKENLNGNHKIVPATSSGNRNDQSGPMNDSSTGSFLQSMSGPFTLHQSTFSHVSDMSTTSQGIPIITPDFSHGVIVECVRVRGDTIAFHRHCAAVLSSARSDSDGLEDFRCENVSLLHSPYGFGYRRSRAARGRTYQSLSTGEIYALEQDVVPNLIQLEKMKKGKDLNHKGGSGSKSNSTAVTFAALEHSLDLLEKDRLDANLLGIQSLVLLTDQGASGIETAYLASLSVLSSSKDSKFGGTGAGHSNSSSSSSSSVGSGGQHRSLVRLHEKVMSLLIGKFTCPKRFISLDDDSSDDDDEFESEFSMGAEADQPSTHNSESIVAEYNVTIRSYALQVLTNALTNVIYHSEDFPLMLPRPTCEEYMTMEFLQKIAEDLAGATRPPMASLGSAHEATLASRFLHLIAAYSEQGYCVANEAMVGSPPRPIHGLLQRAHDAGSVSHRALELETQVALTALGGKF